MLHVFTDITEFTKFKDMIKTFPGLFLDLSKVLAENLAEESTSIVNHHSSCVIFLGYLEPGWMLDLPSQTILRKLFRKFEVGLVCHFTESLPFSWKNEIDTIYTSKSNGSSNSINNGSAVLHESKV